MVWLLLGFAADRTAQQLFGVVLVWQSDTNRCFPVQRGRGTPTDEVATPGHFSVQGCHLVSLVTVNVCLNE